MDPLLAELLAPRLERLGYLGEFFRVTGHQPGALIPFIQLTEELKQLIPNNLTEVVALTVATLTRNDYERIQHERLSLKLGFPEAWIRSVIALNRELLSEQERRVQQLAVDAVTGQGRGSLASLEAVVSSLGHSQAVAVLMLVGRYAMHALIANTLELAPPVPSPLED